MALLQLNVRVLTPEVSPAYVFLASQDASYITGQTIHVDGGDTTVS